MGSDVKYSTAKRVDLKDRSSFMVGPLARVITNASALPSELVNLLRSARKSSSNAEPSLILLARLIETAYLILRIAELLDDYEEKPLRGSINSSEGSGVAVVEAPRGILLHQYRVRGNTVTQANIITPTAFFAADLEDSIR